MARTSLAALIGIVMLSFLLLACTSLPVGLGQFASGCGLPQAAFCDTFDTPQPGGPRTGEMSHDSWSAARLSQADNPSQGMIDQYWATKLAACGNGAGVLPDADFRVCDGHRSESLNDGGQFVINEAYVRQPFDFAGRTGSITFDVDAKTDGPHTWWPEIWLTNLPVPAPSVNANPGMDALPEDGLQIMLSNDCGPNTGGAGELRIIQNYAVVADLKPNAGLRVTGGEGCYPTQPGILNHFEVKISPNEIQVWASDPGGANFKEYDDAAELDLSFTRGYLHIEHVQYNADKFDHSSIATKEQTYTWDNIGFDGPFLPTDRAYDVPDATQSNVPGAVNLGYDLHPGTKGLLECCVKGNKVAAPPIVLSNMRVSDARAAFITLNVEGAVTPLRLQYRFNGEAWQTYTVPAASAYRWTAPAIPLDLAQLHNGTNTLEFQSANELQLANIGVKVVPATLRTATSTASAMPAETPGRAQSSPSMPSPSSTP